MLPADTVNNALPAKLTLSRDALLKAIGYINPKNLIKHIHAVGNKKVSISSHDKNPVLDPGEKATMAAAPRSTTAIDKQLKYGEEWNIDIGYGPCTAIGQEC